MNQLPNDIAPGCSSDSIHLSVTFADGTYGTALYSGLSNKWDSSFSNISPLDGLGFLKSCKLHYLYHSYSNSLPMAWSGCSMKYSNNFDLNKDVRYGSNFGADKSGWNYADFTICCGDSTSKFNYIEISFR